MQHKYISADLALLVVCFAFHTTLSFYLGYWQNFEEMKWIAPDSQTYLEVAHWLFGEVPSEEVFWSIATRPVGYPMILGVCERITPIMLSVFQTICWSLSQWLLFRILRDRVGSFWISSFIILLSVCCLTPISLTFVALSETVFLLLLIASLYFAHQYDSNSRLYNLTFMLLAMSLGITVKPAGMYLYLIMSALVVIYYHKRARYIAVVFFSAIPIILQVSILYYYFDIVKVSMIDSLTLDHYLLSRSDNYLLQTPLHVARHIRREIAYNKAFKSLESRSIYQYNSYVQSQLSSYLLNVPRAVLIAYIRNLIENIHAGSAFVEIKEPHPLLFMISRYQNIAAIYGGCLLMSTFIILVTIRVFRKKNMLSTRHIRFGLLVCGVFTYYLTTLGISYWQGDRLSLPIYYPALLLVGVLVELEIKEAGKRNVIELKRK